MKIIRKIKSGLSIIYNDLTNLFKANKLFINGFFLRLNGKIVINNNWGDDINISFLQEISNLNVIVKNTSFLYKYLPIKNYNCIGSIIGYFTDKHTIIWGAGIKNPKIAIPRAPLKVYSVRGPLTRQILLNHNIKCPEKYGDPALLISRYYFPRLEKKYELGIIPHYTDMDNEYINSFSRNNPNILVIRMSGYNHWHDIPDQILLCKKIISSSLHGLIISDSYGIPNSWIEFPGKSGEGTFKYLDYFASVGRTCNNPIIVKSTKDIEYIINNDMFEMAKDIDYDSIFESCPFKNNLKDYRKFNLS